MNLLNIKESNIFLNNQKINYQQFNINILQFCNINRVNIPKFCFHETLTIAGNCRMCLVEVKGNLKPLASCAVLIQKDMSIYTDTKLVKKAREGVLEFLLINHPLDCPICDQGGECDLQDQTLIYGNDKGRFYDFKRSVKDKFCGFLIKTIMTRCIQCTKCIRFLSEIAGVTNFGLIGRGSRLEISQYINKSINSELSGNIIDLCPVGALTSKPYSFVARSWELFFFNTIDVQDSFLISIRLDLRDYKILRVLPCYIKGLNDNFISDLTRFSYDGFFNNRIISPLVKNFKLGSFLKTTWLNIINNLKKIKFQKINFFLGSFLDAETCILLKIFLNLFGNFSLNTSNIFFRNSNCDFRQNFIINNLILENILNSDIVVLFLNNLRIENPILNMKLKKLVKIKKLRIFTLGNNFNYNFFHYNLGNSLRLFKYILEGKHFLSNFIMKNLTPVFFLFDYRFLNYFFNVNGVISFFNFFKKFNIYSYVLNFKSTLLLLNEFNLQNTINSFHDLSFKKLLYLEELVYFLNTDSIILKETYAKKTIYQGTNFIYETNFQKFDYILPSVSFFEKNGFFINFLGNIQKSFFIIFPSKYARSDLQILNIIFSFFIKNLKYLNRSEIIRIFFFYNFFITYNNFFLLNNNIRIVSSFANKNIISTLTNLLLSTSIAKSSKNMVLHNTYLKNFLTNF